MAILEQRKESFNGWPPECPVSWEDVARAGFVFQGYSDCVRCFYCNGGLRNWEQGDDPYVEHARWFPNCVYIRQIMGQAFVNAVQERKKTGQTKITYKDIENDLEEQGQVVVNALSTPPVERDVAVTSLIHEGFPREDVVREAQALRSDNLSLSVEELYKRLTRQQSVASTNTQTSVDEDVEGIIEQNRSLRHNLLCKICMDREVRVVFLPCGHLISCQECSTALRECPVCRGHIRACVMAQL